MNWRSLVAAVADRTELPMSEVMQVLDTAMDVTLAALVAGEPVVLRRLGRLEARRLAPRAIRRIDTHTKFYLGNRRVIRFRAAAEARRQMETGDGPWRDPDHQAALRVAYTLVSDLALYHPAKAPRLSPRLSDREVRDHLTKGLGAVWERAERSYESTVPATVREGTAYLIDAARRHFDDARTGDPEDSR